MTTSPPTEALPAAFAVVDPGAPRVTAELLAEGITSTLRMTRAMVTADRRVDLHGLDRMVGLVCARALDLPPAEGAAMRPRLTAMLAELDALGTALAAAGPP